MKFSQFKKFAIIVIHDNETLTHTYTYLFIYTL